MSVADLVSELADRQRRLDVLDPGGDVRAAVRNVFSWSVQHLNADAAMVFRRLGLHPGPQFEAGAVAALADIDLSRAGKLLDVLARAHLVRPLSQHRFALHDLLRAYAAELTATLDLYATRESAVGRLLDHYLSSAYSATVTLYPAWRGYRHGKPAEEVSFSQTDARAWLDAELPNFAALGAFAAANGRPDHAIGLATNLYRHLESGHHLDAMTLQSHALAAARDAGDCRAQAHLLTNLGDLHRLLGLYPPAIEHLTQALALHRKTGERRGQARTLSDLGIVAERRGDYEAASGHHREALAIYAELGDSLGEAGVLVNLGNVDTELERNHEAAEGFQRAFELFGLLGDRAGQAIALASLGDALTRLERYPEAEKRLEEALDLFREIGHRYGEATALNNLATMALRLRAYDEAAVSFRAALEIFRETGHRYGEAHSLNGLGEASHACGDRAAARALHSEALAIATETGDLDEQIRAKNGLRLATTE
jgi:tetratricopeptide (TPR) repeat protein